MFNLSGLLAIALAGDRLNGGMLKRSAHARAMARSTDR